MCDKSVKKRCGGALLISEVLSIVHTDQNFGSRKDELVSFT